MTLVDRRSVAVDSFFMFIERSSTSFQTLRKYWPAWTPPERWRYGLFDGGFLRRSIVEQVAFETDTWRVTRNASRRVCAPQEKLLPSLVTTRHRLAPSGITLSVPKRKASCSNVSAVARGTAAPGFFAVKRLNTPQLCDCMHVSGACPQS